jgi:hypothetical protein
MLTEHDMTEKLLKQLITEKKQELEKITKNDPRIIEITNDINDFKQTLSKYNEDPLAALLYQKIINMKKESLQHLTTYHHEIIKLKTEITALETTLDTITKIKEQPEKTVEKEVTNPPKTFAIIKATPLLPKPIPVHPLDRPSVDEKIDLFNKQGTSFVIKKDYKNCNLSLWGEKGNLISFSQYNRNIDDSAIEELDTWLDKTVKYSGYYNKLKKIFKKTNKDFLISSVFDKQGDRIYVTYCHNSKSPNTKSVLHIKKKGKSYIETTKEINTPKDFLEIPLKNNTTLEVSGLRHLDYNYDYDTLTVEIKHLEKQVKQNDLEKHFENIFNALNKQNHLG